MDKQEDSQLDFLAKVLNAGHHPQRRVVYVITYYNVEAPVGVNTLRVLTVCPTKETAINSIVNVEMDASNSCHTREELYSIIDTSLRTNDHFMSLTSKLKIRYDVHTVVCDI